MSSSLRTPGALDRTEPVLIWFEKAQGNLDAGLVSYLPEMPIISFQRMEPTLIPVAPFPAASGDERPDKYFVVAITMSFRPRACPLAPWNCLTDGAGFLHNLPSHYLVILSVVRNPSQLMLADTLEN